MGRSKITLLILIPLMVVFIWGCDNTPSIDSDYVKNLAIEYNITPEVVVGILKTTHFDSIEENTVFKSIKNSNEKIEEYRYELAKIEAEIEEIKNTKILKGDTDTQVKLFKLNAKKEVLEHDIEYETLMLDNTKSLYSNKASS